MQISMLIFHFTIYTVIFIYLLNYLPYFSSVFVYLYLVTCKGLHIIFAYKMISQCIRFSKYTVNTISSDFFNADILFSHYIKNNDTSVYYSDNKILISYIFFSIFHYSVKNTPLW